MINLIPNQEKKKMRAVFYYRLTTILFIALGLTMLIATASLVPALLLSSVKNELVSKKIDQQKENNISEIDQNVLEVVESVNDKINTIKKSKQDTFMVSERVVDAILDGKMSDIKIFEISFVDNGDTGKLVKLSGEAPSRERLLIFSKNLESSPLFKSVDLPISNFIKGTNINFSLSLVAS